MSSHKRVTLIGGGAFYCWACGCMLVYMVFSILGFGMFVAIMGINFIDDINPLFNRVRLVVHFGVMLPLF